MSQITITLLFLLFAIVMFMWEKIPLGLTSMIVCVGLVVTGVLEWQTAFAGFIDSNVILFVAMFIVGVMSGFLSNTGTAAILIPVVIGIAAKSGYSRSRLLMPLVFAAAMGGNLTLIGASGNMIAQSGMEGIGLKFGFFDYAKVGVPMILVATVVSMILLPIFYPFFPGQRAG